MRDPAPQGLLPPSILLVRRVSVLQRSSAIRRVNIGPSSSSELQEGGEAPVSVSEGIKELSVRAKKGLLDNCNASFIAFSCSRAAWARDGLALLDFRLRRLVRGVSQDASS
ncbi:hypothetical protein NDU88_005889 [Pleurodeles waltl]|uniref:Uncharacterized protein n=1 Tax=Pleurodeles waltl TaxID=8319 RepID=A0AAV7QLZ8_PLEWA|nr:hypothetical protein NDU88_005889 [Pleurodeles waltl]